MAENFYVFSTKADFRNYPLNAKFIEQPPEDLRKSNFFKFTVEFSAPHEPIFVEKASFEKFLHENNNDTRNGIMYSLRFRYSSGREDQRYLYLTLVDASSFDPIRYEGQDDSPKMKRVLLTHEAICTRCSQQKSCGNKSEAPSDPRIMDRGQVLQFFLKCNQNCLKGAGNPRDMRRFALAVSFEDITYSKNKIAAVSNKIFVHNNSKHSRKRKKDVEIKSELLTAVQPSELLYVHPKVGTIDSSFSFHSKEWCKSGVSFRCLGTDLIITSMIFQAAMTVYIPRCFKPGTILVTLYYNGDAVFSFPYELQSKVHYDMRSSTSGFLLLRSRSDPGGYVPHGPDNSVAYIMEGVQYESCYFQTGTYAPVPFNYAHNPNYPHSSSSLSPNSGSRLSGDHSPVYMPPGF